MFFGLYSNQVPKSNRKFQKLGILRGNKSV